MKTQVTITKKRSITVTLDGGMPNITSAEHSHDGAMTMEEFKSMIEEAASKSGKGWSDEQTVIETRSAR